MHSSKVEYCDLPIVIAATRSINRAFAVTLAKTIISTQEMAYTGRGVTDIKIGRNQTDLPPYRRKFG
jgi:hypothetical protein